MTVLDALDNRLFSLPKMIGNEGMPKFLELTFRNYQELLSQVAEDGLSEQLGKQQENIVAFGEHIISALNYYLKGQTHSAYSDFTSAMAVLKPFLFPKDKGQVVKVRGLHEPFFRARVGKKASFSKGEMFHLPFSKRQYANTQRFSMPGLPCLYLSNSVYVCWEELNRPAMNEFHISRFQQECFDLNVLDLSLTPTRMKWHCRSYNKSLNDPEFANRKFNYDYLSFWFLMIWPLSFICSLQVRDEEAPFKQEYIFPQFLLQWVASENAVDGIKYFSTKPKLYNVDDYSILTNYVFPPKEFKDEGYCSRLQQSFKLSNSVCMETFMMIDPNGTFINESWLNSVKYKVITEVLRLELIPGFLTAYSQTLFGKMELFMHNLDVSSLSEEI